MKRKEEIDKVTETEWQKMQFKNMQKKAIRDWELIKRNSSIPTKLITVQCNLGQDRQVCLTTEAGADITKSYSVICMRKNLIQKLKGKFWEKMGSDLG